MKRTAIIATAVVSAWMFNATAAVEIEDELQGPSGVQRIGSGAQGKNRNQQGGPGAGNFQRPAPPLLKALDANSDKVIDADEISNAAAALKKLDKNGDGKLTPDEIMPPKPQLPEGEQGQGNREGMGNRRGQEQGMGGNERKGNRHSQDGEGRMERGGEEMGPQSGGGREGGNRRPPVPPFIKALDANGDKVVSADEIANFQKSIMKLDKNGDGELTIDELLPRPPRPPEGEQGGQMGRGRGQNSQEGMGNRRGHGGSERPDDRGDHMGPPPQNEPDDI